MCRQCGGEQRTQLISRLCAPLHAISRRRVMMAGGCGLWRQLHILKLGCVVLAALEPCSLSRCGNVWPFLSSLICSPPHYGGSFEFNSQTLECTTLTVPSLAFSSLAATCSALFQAALRSTRQRLLQAQYQQASGTTKHGLQRQQGTCGCK